MFCQRGSKRSTLTDSDPEEGPSSKLTKTDNQMKTSKDSSCGQFSSLSLVLDNIPVPLKTLKSSTKPPSFNANRKKEEWVLLKTLGLNRLFVDGLDTISDSSASQIDNKSVKLGLSVTLSLEKEDDKQQLTEWVTRMKDLPLSSDSSKSSLIDLSNFGEDLVLPNSYQDEKLIQLTTDLVSTFSPFSMQERSILNDRFHALEEAQGEIWHVPSETVICMNILSDEVLLSLSVSSSVRRIMSIIKINFSLEKIAEMFSKTSFNFGKICLFCLNSACANRCTAGSRLPLCNRLGCELDPTIAFENQSLHSTTNCKSLHSICILCKLAGHRAAQCLQKDRSGWRLDLNSSKKEGMYTAFCLYAQNMLTKLKAVRCLSAEQTEHIKLYQEILSSNFASSVLPAVIDISSDEEDP